MSTDRVPEDAAAEAEAVRSLQQAPTAEAEDVEGHVFSVLSAACNTIIVTETL
ncbi:hypothetical protein ACIHEI_19040 [Kitasatospora sp. NPDC051984]|uniref:hypothetical protein n=1 Tax=Kitasatospora sp. NPDC051984 TaxID=3364059 RepID=UPI0037C5A611